MTRDFAAAAARIEANPLGRIMYGQRELFHSNLLAWFFDVLPDAADAVFAPLAQPGSGTGGERRVERERANLDLVMHWPDRAPVAIENKVFSLPRAEQLDEYRAVTAPWTPPPTLVLLSISPPHFAAPGWRYLSYQELAEGIDDALPASSDYNVETMRRYVQLARDLHALLAAVDVRSDDEPVWLTPEFLGAVSSSQTRQALLKARSQRVARAINELIPDLEQPAGSGLTRATPLVEALEYAFVDGLHLHLGWQLQGNQFRRAVVYHDESIQGGGAAARAAREALSREHPEFFTMPDAVRGSGGGRKEFNHFAPGFVYVYAKQSGMTVGELKRAAVEVHAEVVALQGDL
jgi:hypothetical protein